MSKGGTMEDNQDEIWVASDKRTIRIRHDMWEWGGGIDNVLWRKDVAHKFLAIHGIDKEWEMTQHYASTGCTIGISLRRREDVCATERT